MSISPEMYDFIERPFAIDLLCGVAEIHYEELIEECAPNIRFIHNTIEYGDFNIHDALDIYKYIYDIVEIGLNSTNENVSTFYEKHYDEEYLYECWNVLTNIHIAIRNSVDYDPIDNVFIITQSEKNNESICNKIKFNYDVFMYEAGNGCTITDINGEEFIIYLTPLKNVSKNNEHKYKTTVTKKNK